MGNKISLQEELINLKMTSKQMPTAAPQRRTSERQTKNLERGGSPPPPGKRLKDGPASGLKGRPANAVGRGITQRRLNGLLRRSASKKCEKNEKVAKTNVKKAIEKGNMEGARIYAQNAIREKTQGLNYLKMSSRIDAVGQRLETAIRTNDMSKAMGNVVKGMASALQSMDVEKISRVMDSFEQQFESMDVRAGYMESSMNSTTASATPEDQVDGLISQIADEHQLDVSFALDDAGTMGTKVPAQPAKKEDADLASRLDALNR